jgi:hypothetical protein
MRLTSVMLAVLFIPGIALAQSVEGTPPAPAVPAPSDGGISCAQIPDAQRFVDQLRPGPNTREAQRHLDAARNAGSEQQCIAELRQVDKYAKRSSAADRQIAEGVRHPRRHIQCADAMHQNRPGGTDYKGPPVIGCPTPKL